MSSAYPLAHEIILGLWLGSIESSHPTFLKFRNIEAVLSILGNFSYVERVKPQMAHEVIIMPDGDPYDENDIKKGLEFISSHHNNGTNVLVHCLAGVSRSTSMVAGYLMKKKQWNPAKTLQFIAGKRSIVAPATDTFNSVISFIYGKNTEFFCKICQKQWQYTANYDSFNKQYAIPSYCSCFDPDLTPRKKN